MQRKPVEILVADDSVTIQKVIELTFSDGPYRVTNVSDGNIAADTALRLKPDIVLADIHMPGLTGYQVCALVKKQLVGTPVLLMVGNFERLDDKAVQDAGADGVVTKPFESQKLISQVDSLVASANRDRARKFIVAQSDTLSNGALEPRSRQNSKLMPPLRVFLCHASEDKPAVRKLYKQFLAESFHPWLDEEDLLPGEDWRRAITKQLRQCDAVVVCLSHRSVTKTGYVQKEIATALDILAEQPEGTIFVIPLLLEDCDIPERLAHLHTARVPVDEGFKRVCRAIRKRLGADAASTK